MELYKKTEEKCNACDGTGYVYIGGNKLMCGYCDGGLVYDYQKATEAEILEKAAEINWVVPENLMFNLIEVAETLKEIKNNPAIDIRKHQMQIVLTNWIKTVLKEEATNDRLRQRQKS